MLPALLLALLVTQAASFVCNAQCVQRQLPGGSARGNSTMAHCHSMATTQPAATVQTAAACTHTRCAIDLLANGQGKSEVQARPFAVNAGPHQLLFVLNIASFTPAYPSPRSSIVSPPLITALRV
jgi:hypothetical protein